MYQESAVIKDFWKMNMFIIGKFDSFLGLHKYAPALALNGELGWNSCEVRWRASVVIRGTGCWVDHPTGEPVKHYSGICLLEVNGPMKYLSYCKNVGLRRSTMKKWQWKWRSLNKISRQNTHKYELRKSGGSWNWELMLRKVKHVEKKYVQYNFPKSLRPLCTQ